MLNFFFTLQFVHGVARRSVSPLKHRQPSGSPALSHFWTYFGNKIYRLWLSQWTWSNKWVDGAFYLQKKVWSADSTLEWTRRKHAAHTRSRPAADHRWPLSWSGWPGFGFASGWWCPEKRIVFLELLLGHHPGRFCNVCNFWELTCGGSCISTCRCAGFSMLSSSPYILFICWCSADAINLSISLVRNSGFDRATYPSRSAGNRSWARSGRALWVWMDHIWASWSESTVCHPDWPGRLAVVCGKRRGLNKN